MFRPAIISLALALAPDASARDWPSAPFRGQSPDNPPCSCRAPGTEVEVGRELCLPTPSGLRRARCVMVLNNTSWDISAESCGATAALTQ